MPKEYKEDSKRIAEVSPGIFIELPPKLGFLGRLIRRFHQLSQALFSSKFKLPLNTINDYEKRYDSKEEIYYYEKIANAGFYGEEEWTFKETLKRSPNIKSVLIVGCGTGREAKALEELSPNLDITAIDISSNMLEVAKQYSSKIKYLKKEIHEIKEEEKFDLIFITFSLINHIHHSQNREKFLAECLKRLSQQGLLLNGYFVKQVSLFNRFNISSQILRLRWLLTGDWQKGDVLQSYLGHHNDALELEYFHFYQSDLEIEEELKSIGNLSWEKMGTPAEVFNGGLNHYYLIKKSI